LRAISFSFAVVEKKWKEKEVFMLSTPLWKDIEKN
jgi:hypothetical protein